MLIYLLFILFFKYTPFEVLVARYSIASVVPSNIADKKWKDNQNVVAYIIELVTVGMAGLGGGFEISHLSRCFTKSALFEPSVFPEVQQSRVFNLNLPRNSLVVLR